MTMITPSYLGETIEYSSLHACRSTLEDPTQSLEYLRRAMEAGYKDLKNVYKDQEFAELRKSPRFTELMASKAPAIPD